MGMMDSRLGARRQHSLVWQLSSEPFVLANCVVSNATLLIHGFLEMKMRTNFWPWLHYVRIDSESKAPSGKMCIICRTVFRLCGLKQEHQSVSKYLKWKNEKDSVTRHSFFMKAQKKYLELCAVKGEDVTRLHVRQREHLSVFTVVHIVFDCVILFFACLY